MKYSICHVSRRRAEVVGAVGLLRSGVLMVVQFICGQYSALDRPEKS